MRKSPQKEAAERKAAAKHEENVRNAKAHLVELRKILTSSTLKGSEGQQSKRVILDELARLINNDDVYLEAAAYIFLDLNATALMTNEFGYTVVDQSERY